ncbi:MAG TPA: hypothetical protein VFP43_17485 [Mesorhizobium sp.]|nr:hypothetical protein [Mesorhizobium sp.]
MFQHACKMGLEGYRLEAAWIALQIGERSPDWLKFKYPDASAVKREAEED